MLTISWVGRDRLGDLPANRLGDGGQGVVYAVPDPPGKFAGEYLAYKEYLPAVTSDADALYELVNFFDELGRTDRHDHSYLDKRLTWPVALVYTGARPTRPLPHDNPGTTVTGFLMQRITEEFELDSARLGKVKPQDMAFLLNDDAFTRSLGLDVDDGRRLRLLIDLAAILNRLHRHRVTVGDLSPKNVLFMLDPSPKCLLIDCDSMRLAGKDVLPQVETDDWAVPEAAKATPASDTYKFGLIATRLFNRHQTSTDLTGLRNVSSALANLAERSRASDPGARPPMAEWLRVLEQARAQLKQRPPAPPRPRQSRPGPPVTPRQQPVTRPNAGFQFPSPGSNPPPSRPRQSPVTPFPQPAAQPNQPTQSAPYTPYAPYPAPQRRPSHPGLSAAARAIGVVVVLLIVAGGWLATTRYSPFGDTAAPGDSSSNPSASSGSTSGSSSDTVVKSAPDPTDSPETPAEPVVVDRAVAPGATVDFSQVVDDPRARGVATMFAHFYGAVNERDYAKAMRRYDPHSKVVNIDSAKSRQGWTHDMSTTQESDIALTALSGDGTYTLATVSFRSNQDPGFGPASDPQDTCDDWTITYQLTNTKGYRIFKAPKEGVSYTSC
ncbi:hypothetical protein STRTUCAR8_07637 [Streptomyces turgidiscabies Car8]|uniref:Protein kinase domain-containing protein n=1 Tax=Streptomyces turgidiscabies (strain Car8) TaxID=698760 RepID=L7FAC2_STRT8|nr:hypothetical protein STRTUCAR8_07637 [Streptomyces turgidiscabies Car8]GAQ76939.1 hypothetical protein T45_08751 [Streptomyces turgidiscabies]